MTTDRLVLDNLGLVGVVLRKRFSPAYIARAGYEDCISAGMVGLLEAARRFDPARGLQFTTYATYWVYRRIHEEAVESGMVRVPNSSARLPGAGVLARRARNVQSLDAGNGDRPCPWADPVAEVAQAEEIALALAALARLPRSLAECVRRRYLLGEEYQEIAAAEGVVKSTARVRCMRGLALLRKKLGRSLGVL